MKYSIIVPVYNRPDEVGELLESLSNQTQKDFEVIIVEDGSVKTCKDVCDKYAGILALHYYNKENSGPGQSRNYGAERANGEWLIILDSDVVLPEGYLAAVDREIRGYGGAEVRRYEKCSEDESHLAPPYHLSPLSLPLVVQTQPTHRSLLCRRPSVIR